MNGIINMMHECAHYHIFQKRNVNTFLGQWVLGPLFFTNFDSFRDRHWDHHRFLGSEKDTKDAYLVNIRGWRVFVYFLTCLTGFEALKKFLHQVKKPAEGVPAEGAAKGGMGWVIRLGVFQFLLAASFLGCAYLFHRDPKWALIVAMYAYAMNYLYSIMSVTIFVATLRAIAEHQITAANVLVEGRASLRNFNCTAFSRLVFGSYGFGEHLTHHEHPAIPYYHLQDATVQLSNGDASYAPTGDYPGILCDIVRSNI